jgi:hypothetical protein
MSGLSAERKTPQLGAPEANSDLSPFAATIADDVIIYAGALVSQDNSGYMRPARATSTDKVVGRARRTYDNTIAGHVAGGSPVINVEAEIGVFAYDNDSGSPVLAATQVGTDLYAVDDHTVSLSSSGSSRPYAGKLHHLDANGQVWLIVALRAGVS